MQDFRYLSTPRATLMAIWYRISSGLGCYQLAVVTKWASFGSHNKKLIATLYDYNFDNQDAFYNKRKLQTKYMWSLMMNVKPFNIANAGTSIISFLKKREKANGLLGLGHPIRRRKLELLLVYAMPKE